MKRPNITPGPWRLALYNYRASVTESGLPVADLQACHHVPYGASARAIAAVPELLAALETALSVIEDLPYPANYPAEALRAALTKAGYEFP